MASKLDSEEVAYAYAGVDTNFTLAKLYTVELKREKENDTGQFVLDMQGYLPELEQRRNPVAWLRQRCRVYIRHCVQTTSVPQDKWIIEFSPVLAKFGIPSHLILSRPDDLAWLQNG